MPRKRRPWVGFALFAVLAILGLFVLDGIAAGVDLFVAFLVLIFASMYTLRGEDPDAVVHNSRTAGSGWFGGWF